MFDIGWSELLIIAVVTIIVVGPKDLPRLLRSLGQMARKLRSTANEFRGHIDDVIRDAELEDLKSTVEDVKSMNPINQIKKSITDEIDGVRDIVEDDGVRNYHKDFPDDEPYEDFDDPGAEWSDEDDELIDAPQPKPSDGGKAAEAAQDLKPGKSRPKDNKDGPDADRSDDKKIGVAGSEAPQETAPGPKAGKKSGVRTASAEN